MSHHYNGSHGIAEDSDHERHPRRLLVKDNVDEIMEPTHLGPLNPQLQALKGRVQEMECSIAQILELLCKPNSEVEPLPKHPQDLLNDKKPDGTEAED